MGKLGVYRCKICHRVFNTASRRQTHINMNHKYQTAADRAQLALDQRRLMADRLLNVAMAKYNWQEMFAIPTVDSWDE